MDYQQKYQKYKKKYIDFKNKLFGGELYRFTNIDPSFIPPPLPEMPNYSDIYATKHPEMYMGYINIYTKIEEILGFRPEIFILKVGSNDMKTTDSGRCENDRCKHYIYDDNGLFSDIPKKLQINFMNLIRKHQPDTKSKVLLQIDPYDKTFYPFDEEVDESLTIINILKYFSPPEEKYRHFIKGFFPLSRDKITDNKFEDTIINRIIKLLIDYNGLLVLHNAIGSQCYGIFKVILDLRKLYNKETIYSGVANVPEHTDCELDISKSRFRINNDDILPLDINY